MARRRYIYDSARQELVEVTPEYEAPARNAHTADGVLWNDRHYTNTRGPNGEDLSSRTKHREFMKQTGLTTMDDFQSTWDKSAKQRAEYFTQGKGSAIKREHIERAIHELTTRKR